MNVMIAVLEATKIKPAFDEPCNNCGWCCLTGVCVVGQGITGSDDIPCKLLESHGGKHYCKVAKELKIELAIGSGCDSKTQMEVINEAMKCG